MIQTSLVYTDLSANHKMWTQGRLDPATGHLEANTRTATFTWFGGYTGGVQLALLDTQNFIIYRTQAHRFGVDGTLIGRSDRTDVWDEWIPTAIAGRAATMQVFHFWSPNWTGNLNQWLSIGSTIAQAIAGVVATFGAKAGTGK